MEKEIKYGGMQFDGNDYTTDDGEMLFAYNLEKRNGVYHATQIPSNESFELNGFTPLFLHNPEADNTTADIVIGIYETNEDGEEGIQKKLAAFSFNDRQQQVHINEDIILKTDDSLDNFSAIGNIVCYTNNGEFKLLFFKDGQYYAYDRLPPRLNLKYNVVRRIEKASNQKQDTNELFPPADKYVNNCVVQVSNDSSIGKGLWVEIASKSEDWTVNSELDSNGFVVTSDAFEKKQNAILGALNQARAYLMKKGYLTTPVLIRYAYRLYDGTTIMPSPPVLTFPLEIYPQVYYSKYSYSPQETSLDKDYWIAVFFDAYRIFAEYEAPEDGNDNVIQKLEKWEDLIVSVDFFISEPLYNIDTDKLNVFIATTTNSNELHSRDVRIKFNRRDPKKILESVSNFYLIKSVPINKLHAFNTKESNPTCTSETAILPNDLTNYITLETLSESVYDNSKLIIGNAICYNGRFALSDIKRLVCYDYDLTLLSPNFYIESGKDKKINDIVTYGIDGTNGLINEKNFLTIGSALGWADADEQTSAFFFQSASIDIYATKQKQDAYLIFEENQAIKKENVIIPRVLCFPDLKIKDLIIYKSPSSSQNLYYYKYGFDKFPLLNAAYIYFPPKKTLYPYNEIGELIENFDANNTAGSVYFATPNLIKESETNNPFVFKDGNSTTCGNGSIITIQTNTQPLSQGQFGSYPIFAFCTDGIFAISIGSDGTFQSRVPFSRDIIASKKSVAHLTNELVYATKDGIYLLSNGQTIPLLHESVKWDFDEGKTEIWDNVHSARETLESNYEDSSKIKLYDIRGFLDAVEFAYDEYHNRLIAYNCNRSDLDFIYSFSEQAWSVLEGQNIISSLNAYDRCLLVTSDNKIWNYSSTKETTPENGFLITRSLKLGYPDVLKTIHAIIQRGTFPENSVRQILFGSRDNQNWFPVWSSKTEYMRGFRGTPYKYFRLAIFAKGLKDEYFISGSTISFAARMTDQIR